MAASSRAAERWRSPRVWLQSPPWTARRQPQSRLWARSFSTSGACHPRRPYEISASSPSLRDSSREGSTAKDSGTKGGSALGPQSVGPPSCPRLEAACIFSRLSSQSAVRTKAFRSSVGQRAQAEAGGPASVPCRRPATGREDRLRCRGTAHSSSGLGRRPLTAVARVRIPYAPLLHSAVTRSRRRSPMRGRVHAPSRAASCAFGGRRESSPAGSGRGGP